MQSYMYIDLLSKGTPPPPPTPTPGPTPAPASASALVPAHPIFERRNQVLLMVLLLLEGLKERIVKKINIILTGQKTRIKSLLTNFH